MYTKVSISLPLALILVLTSGTVQAREKCESPDYAKLSKSVVSITLMYETPLPDGTIGHRGTAWFVDDTHLATVGHITDTEGALDENWRNIQISYGSTVREEVDTEFEISARLSGTIETGTHETISIIEIRAPLMGFNSVTIRRRPLQKNEPVVGVGYRKNSLQFAEGYFYIPDRVGEPSADAESPSPYMFFELTNEQGDDRYIFNRGASGSPLFDCDGNVVAIVSGIVKQVVVMMDMSIQTTSASGEPNYFAVSPSGIVLD